MNFMINLDTVFHQEYGGASVKCFCRAFGINFQIFDLLLIPSIFFKVNPPHMRQPMNPMDREFPTLGAGDQQESGADNRDSQPPEPQYGPGPSLRPQSKCNFALICSALVTVLCDFCRAVVDSDRFAWHRKVRNSPIDVRDLLDGILYAKPVPIVHLLKVISVQVHEPVWVG